MNELDKLIKKYYEHRIDLNNNQIKQVITAIKIDKKLENYINKVEVRINSSELAEGSYTPSSEIIRINVRNIYFSFYKWCRYKKIQPDSKIAYKYINMFILNTILHETEHANQNRSFIEQNKPSSLNEVIKEGMELGYRVPDNLTTKEKLLYKYCYDDILTERNAKIMSLINILKINKNIDALNQNEELYICRQLLYEIIDGYHMIGDKINNPTEKYYNLRNKNKEYKELSFNENYEMEDILSWGLPIDKDTYCEIIDLINDTKPKKLQKILKI